jgi:hypothetical protein
MLQKEMELNVVCCNLEAESENLFNLKYETLTEEIRKILIVG